MTEQVAGQSTQPASLVETLLTTAELLEQMKLLVDHVDLLDQHVVDALKTQADHYLRSEIQKSLDFAALILEAARLTASPLFQAWGLLARGNALSIGLGEYKKALVDFDEALNLFGQQGRVVEQARVEIGRTVAYICLGEFPLAFQSGDTACRILAKHEQWQLLATATMNLGIAHFRAGEDTKALAIYDQAVEVLTQLEDSSKTHWAWIQNNRVVCLRNLGKFDEAITTSQIVQEELLLLGQTIEAARAQQGLGLIYFVLGRYNEALDHFDQVHTVFAADNRRRDTAMVDLFISDCLLRLGQFGKVLETCQRVRKLFDELDAKPVVAQTLVNEAIAYIRLGCLPEGIRSLQEAQDLFQQLGNTVWVAMVQIEQAGVYYQQQQWQESATLAQTAAKVLSEHGLVVEQAQACLMAARAYLSLHQDAEAQRLIDQVLVVASTQDLPLLLYQSHTLAGQLQESRHHPLSALTAYDQAIGELERLRGRLMLEHRANFLADKQLVYEDAVRLCLELQQDEQGLRYAERAKSRTLLDLVAYRLDLGIQARRPEDQALVAEINNLRIQRDQYYRRWETSEEVKLRGWGAADEQQERQQELLTIEKRITELWHKLLVHNADYARDATLWQVQADTGQSALPAQTVLVEYFTLGEQLVAFVVTPEHIQSVRLPATMGQVQRVLQFLTMNLATTPYSQPEQASSLLKNIQGQLAQLHRLLVAPLQAWLPTEHALIVVPHGVLHYVPFPALYDGQRYLLEEREVRYLPGASFLRYCQATPTSPTSGRRLVYANTWHGQLPNTVKEATTIAGVLGTDALHDEQLGRVELQQLMAEAQIIHLATHGDFRADNPLFSGLWVGDGWLTTLDIFNMRFQAALVTLSGCQTGRTVVQAGDELAGLMRAFLSAGAASLVLSLWSVEDEATAQLMQLFYQHLKAGAGKGAALRAAQLALLRGELPGDKAQRWQHPFYWAPFFLVGNADPL